MDFERDRLQFGEWRCVFDSLARDVRRVACFVLCALQRILLPLVPLFLRSDEVLRGQGSQKSVKVKSPRGAQRVEWSM